MRLNATKLLADIKLSVESWNSQVDVGDLVNYRDDGGKDTITRTRSRAQVLSNHTPVVWIEGRAGCVLLNRVTPIAGGG